MIKRIIIDEKETNYTITTEGIVTNIITNKQLKGFKHSSSDYRVVQLTIDGIKKKFYLHRLVAETFLGKPEDNNMVVNHIDGNKTNNCLKNLEWATRSQNSLHAINTRLTSKERPKANYYENDLPNERWISIKGYEGLYEISNYGRVKSFYSKQARLLKPSTYSGYEKVVLVKNGNKKPTFIHYLVFTHFIDDIIEEGYCIDHIDGNKLNNHFTNLRKITNSENTLAAYHEQNSFKKKRIVIAYKNGIETGRYDSFAQAGRELDCDSSSISKCCKGKLKQVKGYIFKCIEI